MNLHLEPSRQKALSTPQSQKLEHLRNLGITHVELMPVAVF